jgi:hypothetical protein
VWKGVIPPRAGVEGTIGVANRYQSEQISGADVVLDPAQLNDIIQSDVFHRLAKNPEFKKIVADDNFKSIVASEEFSRLVKNQEFLTLVQRDDFNKFASSGELGKLALTPVEYEKRFNAPVEYEKRANAPVEYEKRANAPVEYEKRQAVAVEYMKNVKVPVEYQALANSSEWKKLTSENPDFAQMILNPSFAKAINSSPEMAKILTSGDFQKLISTDLGARPLAAPEMAAKVLEYSPRRYRPSPRHVGALPAGPPQFLGPPSASPLFIPGPSLR